MAGQDGRADEAAWGEARVNRELYPNSAKLLLVPRKKGGMAYSLARAGLGTVISAPDELLLPPKWELEVLAGSGYLLVLRGDVEVVYAEGHHNLQPGEWAEVWRGNLVRVLLGERPCP